MNGGGRLFSQPNVCPACSRQTWVPQQGIVPSPAAHTLPNQVKPNGSPHAHLVKSGSLASPYPQGLGQKPCIYFQERTRKAKITVFGFVEDLWCLFGFCGFAGSFGFSSYSGTTGPLQVFFASSLVTFLVNSQNNTSWALSPQKWSSLHSEKDVKQRIHSSNYDTSSKRESVRIGQFSTPLHTGKGDHPDLLGWRLKKTEGKEAEERGSGGPWRRRCLVTEWVFDSIGDSLRSATFLCVFFAFFLLVCPLSSSIDLVLFS